MSVGDVKDYRRRLKLRALRSEAPKKAGYSIGELVARNKVRAEKQARAMAKRSK